MQRSITSAFLQCFFLYMVVQASSLKEYNLPPGCSRNSQKVVDIPRPEAGTDSSGIAKNFLSYFSDSNCSLVLRPGIGVSILLAVRSIDFRSNCIDNVTIFTSATQSNVLCGNEPYPYGSQTFISNGPMVIQFRSGSGSTGLHKGFEFVFTAFYASSMSCLDNMSLFKCANGYCISSALRCDGYNHCGDGSDQLNCGSKITTITSRISWRGPTVGQIVGYVFGAIFLLIALVALGIYCAVRNNVITTWRVGRVITTQR